MLHFSALICKRCYVQLHLTNAYKDCGDLIIQCSMCEAKNILAFAVVGKVQIPEWYEVTGWRE
jgi:hypothetical protein